MASTSLTGGQTELPASCLLTVTRRESRLTVDRATPPSSVPATSASPVPATSASPPIRFFADMHDGHPQQDTGMLAGKNEVHSDTKPIPAAVQRTNGPIQRELKSSCATNKASQVRRLYSLRMFISSKIGAGRGNRTPMELPPADFESVF
jgi:hypothetical protein